MANDQRPALPPDPFPAVESGAWRARLVEELGEERFAELAAAAPGLPPIEPLYESRPDRSEHERPGAAPYTRGGPRPAGRTPWWRVASRFEPGDPELLNRAVLADLAGGVDALELALAGPLATLDGLDRALAEVHLHLVQLDLAHAAGAGASRALAEALCARRRLDPERLELGLAGDPLGNLAATGRLAGTLDDAARNLADAARWCALASPRSAAAVVSTAPYAGAGADRAEELACALSAGAWTLRALADGGLSLADAAQQVRFELTVGRELFEDVAKLRAFRLAWTRLLAAAGLEDPPACRVHAVASPTLLTRRDPWSNLLRADGVAFAGVVGGADRVVSTPLEERLGAPGPFARRIARNAQAILAGEAHLGRVADPAGGSFLVEARTESIARSAWERLRELERGGGLAQALRDGSLAARLAATWERRRRDLATRRLAVVGVSDFCERVPSPPPVGTAPRARVGADDAPAGGERVEPLPVHRDAEPFERLAARAAALPGRPRLFLATLGPLKEHGARVTFAENLALAGGLEPVTGAVDAFGASGALAACLCGTDERYADEAEAAARALKAAGAQRVLLAGRPGDRDASFRAAGVDGFVHVGCDAEAALDALLALHEQEVPA